MTRTRNLLVMTVVLSISMIAQEEPPDTLYRANPHYWELCSAWEKDSATPGGIVMLGNSITERGEWMALLHRKDLVNRGIGSDNTYGFLQRMSTVTRLRPRVCFIMGGINDLYAGFSVETVLRNYASILDTLRSHDIIPVVQSTLFASPRWRNAREKNVEVKLLNEGLRATCAREGITFLDLNTLFSRDGLLEDKWTTDGIHLSVQAYRVWAGEILDVLGASEEP